MYLQRLTLRLSGERASAPLRVADTPVVLWHRPTSRPDFYGFVLLWLPFRIMKGT